ncbi:MULTISPECIES: tyrosine-type recombinase/integrase [unclassified Cellulophaga]|uniref:tyrosine-type recombinase/integrase n=1 Tax=unclassified Cellulophaga TaxID=2634405 RepID=UPI0026E23379|nr:MULTISPECIES: phage integrase SAM-like domain-containing protein [unclassified Cellulophaga]MDO6491775.1 phage integrase SAM-like domain-containing protein [Cellulophaga sp. 2_MG-2023]MDO6495570.1 phage integrase SAM-like domain-containing protein [Cellulophaga sp. 3_MG-2023]
MLQSKSENAPIYLRLSVKRGQIIYRKTGLTVNPKNWSSTTGLPKQNDATNKNLTVKLKKLNTYVFDNINNTNVINGDWLLHQIDVFFGRVSENKISQNVLDVIQEIIDDAPTRNNGKGGIGLSQSRINSYRRLYELFNEFQGKENYIVSQLDKQLFENFKKWLLKNKKYSDTYTFKKLSDLKGVCKEARAKGVITSSDLNDIKTKQVSAYDDDMDVITLTNEDIEKIEKADLKSEALINARKWLILAAFTGQRGQALTQRVKKENFEKYGLDLVIKIKQKKGNKHVIIPVLPKVKEIYENGMPYVVSTQKLNEHFKKIGEIAEVDEMILGRKQENRRGVKKLRPKYEYISTHIGRRTFATIHYGKIPTPIIMRVTGHSKESTFLTYINQSDDSHIDTFLEYYKTKERIVSRKPKMEVIKNLKGL